ncbi:sugar ABC transporter substrate-binding protein [Paenibacillus hodogayensis]
MLAMSGSVLAACGNQNDSAADSKEAEKPIELVFHGGQSNWTEEMFWALYGNLIKKKFPHITPKFIQQIGSKVTPADLIAAGEQIDLMLITQNGTMDWIMNNGLQYDISGLIKESKFDLNKFDPSIVNIQRDIAKGGIYALPVFVQIPFMLYNRDLFDKFGVAYPKMGLTWDEAYDLAVKMSRTDSGKKYFGLGVNFDFHIQTSQVPINLVDSSTNKARTDDNLKRMMNNFARFSMIPGYEASQFPNAENAFIKDQNLAMWLHFTNVTRRIPDHINWDAVSLPYYSDMKGTAPAADPYFLYVLANSKYKKQAFDVSAFLTTVEAQIEIAKEGFTPVIRDKAVQEAFGKNNKNYAGKNVAAFFPEKLAAKPPFSPYGTIANNAAGAAFKDFVAGNKDLNTALRDFEQDTNKKIEEELAKKK